MRFLLLILSASPLLAVIYLEGWLKAAILLVCTGLMLLLWIFATPGSRLMYSEEGQEYGSTLFAFKQVGNPGRSILITLLFGILPATGIGAILNWIVAGFPGE